MPIPADDPDPVLPTGTLTFLFTDIEGSTRLWERHPDAMRQAHARHDALVAEAVLSHGGQCVHARGEGDSTFNVFTLPRNAVAAAAKLQCALQAEPWPAETPIRVRMALHMGTADLRDDDYHSSDVNRCARLRALASGGQTLLSQTVAALLQDAPPDGIRLKDLGSHRLKDLSRPEHVFQLLHSGLPADFPPLRSLNALLTNLPSRMTSFVGRETEKAEIQRLLAGHRLLTLTGPGGAGKTRLAEQAAADVLDQYPDGCWAVELAGLSDPSLLPQAVAQALGVREEPGRPLIQTLTEQIKPKSLLLLLDNCEHLLRACEELVDVLLRACPNLRVLATSQQALGIVGTARYPVPPLSLPPVSAALTPDALSQYEAVRLFVERARSAWPGFALTKANSPAVAEICRRLTGSTLALELAAAWCDVLPPEKIAARLTDRFRLLTRGNRAALPRHQALRETIDWSCNLLDAPEKTLFARLSVFAGGWTLEAAESVCAGDGLDEWDILPLLSHLVDKSLVTVEPREDAARYFLLESLHQYGAEKLTALGNADTLPERLCRFFLAFAEEADAHLDGPEEAIWLDKLEMEQDNVRAVLEWSLEHAPESCLNLVGNVYWLWFLRGYLTEWRGWLESALARSPSVSPAVRVKALTGAGILAGAQGDLPASRAWYEQALTVKQAMGDERGIAGTLNNLGMIATQEGDLLAARSLFEQSLTIYRALDDRLQVAKLLSNIGRLASDEGDVENAVRLLSESLTLFQALDSPEGEGTVLENLGEACRLRGEYGKAVDLLQKSYTRRKELGVKSGIAGILRNLGLIAHAQGENTQAVEFLAAGAALRESIGMPLHLSTMGESRAALETLCALLGPAAYQEIWNQGKTLSPEQLMEYIPISSGKL